MVEWNKMHEKGRCGGTDTSWMSLTEWQKVLDRVFLCGCWAHSWINWRFLVHRKKKKEFLTQLCVPLLHKIWVMIHSDCKMMHPAASNTEIMPRGFRIWTVLVQRPPGLECMDVCVCLCVSERYSGPKESVTRQHYLPSRNLPFCKGLLWTGTDVHAARTWGSDTLGIVTLHKFICFTHSFYKASNLSSGEFVIFVPKHWRTPLKISLCGITFKPYVFISEMESLFFPAILFIS